MNSFILYEGPSQIDGRKIVAIVTGLASGSVNSKTGPLAQIYILVADEHPLTALHKGHDHAICGDCKHRGKLEVDKETGISKNVGRSCYVTLIYGPRIVWDSYQRGVYQPVPLAEARDILAGQRVRVGAYGDPGAVPQEIWKTALRDVKELTAYTHLWRTYPDLASFCMASCDTEAERTEAKALGFRTFRVRTKDEPVLKGEGQCPASAEMGKAVQCVSCMICSGNRTKVKADITIQAHGAGRTNFQRARAFA